MSRFTDLFSNTDVPQEPVVQQVVVEEPKVEEPVVVEEPKVEPIVEVLPPKPLQNIARPSLRRTHK